ncbi:hypothetical protein [Sphingosinicella sp. BN140058]|uniref:hypothetical protein n=1 Tax=Sphingosinicella sp. BN140058 TaxID=1892855 RepID=UPI001012BA96|nr:hypothetical protein [Sphingosinicella sp. BN140058]QAY80421.1 hypothetical protein ETR14_27665 [Sphingosinicella sp. BN140058]
MDQIVADPQMLAKTASFLNSIGLEAAPASGAAGFLSAVQIHDGTLRYDPARALPSDLLHEAAHLAILPERFRKLASDDLEPLFLHMCEEAARHVEEDPDRANDHFVRSVLQAGECEATAWAFAAGRAARLPDTVIITDDQYEGEGADIRRGLALGAYLGINGLVASGMCESVRSYPSLCRWLQQ